MVKTVNKLGHYSRIYPNKDQLFTDVNKVNQLFESTRQPPPPVLTGGRYWRGCSHLLPTVQLAYIPPPC